MSDIALMKAQIETQLDEYEREINEFAAFMEDWRNRTDPAQQRVQRFRKAAEQAAAE